MKEYHKIETLFERDEKTRKLIIGKYRSPEVEFLRNNTWQFTEKVDGTNVRIFWDGHNVTFAGRTNNSQMPLHLVNRLNELFGGEIGAQMFEQKFGEKQVELFGEGYGTKIQNGGLYRDDVDFILFDVLIGDNYQSRESVEDIAKYFGIEIVPVIMEGTLQEGLEYILKNRMSIIAKNGAEIEGFVARPKVELKSRNGQRIIVKIKHKDFE